MFFILQNLFFSQRLSLSLQSNRSGQICLSSCYTAAAKAFGGYAGVELKKSFECVKNFAVVNYAFRYIPFLHNADNIQFRNIFMQH